MSIGFDRDRNRRKRELTNNKSQKGEYHIRNLNKDNTTDIGKTKFMIFEWYGPQYKSSISQQAILSKRISNKVPTEP